MHRRVLNLVMFFWAHHQLVFILMATLLICSGCKPANKTITGQVFIATAGGISLGLGAVPVAVCEKADFQNYLEERKARIVAAQKELADAQVYYKNYITEKGYLSDSNYIAEIAELDSKLKQAQKEYDEKKAKLDLLYKTHIQFRDAAYNIERQLYLGKDALPSNVSSDVFHRQMNFLYLRGKPIFIEQFQPSQESELSVGVDRWDSLEYPMPETDLIKSWREFIQINAKTNLNLGHEVYSLKQNLNGIGLKKRETTQRYTSEAISWLSSAKSHHKNLKNGENIINEFQPKPIAETVTDSNGNFNFSCPNVDGLILVCSATRSVAGDKENYHWAIEIPSGASSVKLNLDNHNLLDTSVVLENFK